MSSELDAIPITECPVCEGQVPAADFCGACGTHFTASSATRTHAFAAHPGEHLLHLSVISTMFPHLPHRSAAPFRMVLLGGTLLLLVLALAGLTAAAIAVACLIVPILYLIYLYETDAYEDEPELVIGLTFVLGLVVGIPWTLLTGPYVTATVVENAISSAGFTHDLTAGVLIPLATQALMLIGPLALYWRKYDEALDGFAFGIVCALGFTFSTNLVDLWPQLSQGLISANPTVDSILAILGRGLFIPFIAASTTGLIAAAVWLNRRRRRTATAYGWATTLPVVVGTVILVWIFLGLANIFVASIVDEVIIYAVVVALLLLAVRVALHHMLLAEAVEVDVGPETVCEHCHYLVHRMAFCPHCGVATRATSKRGSGRLLRAFR